MSGSAAARALAPELERPLPANVPVERSILGAVILDGAEAIKDGLKPEHFFLDAHRRI